MRASGSMLGASLTWSLVTASTTSCSPSNRDPRIGAKLCRVPNRPVSTRIHSGCPVWSSRYTLVILPILLPSASTAARRMYCSVSCGVVMAVFLPLFALYWPYVAYADVRAMRRGTRHAGLPSQDSRKQRRLTTVRFQKNCRVRVSLRRRPPGRPDDRSAGDFHVATGGGGHQKLVWIVIGIVVLAGVLAAVVMLVPRIRRLASQQVRPHLVTIWTDLKAIASQPRKIVYVLAGSTASQLFIALCLGASLHAVGQHASLATLIAVLTLASIIGGAVPVPGGAGVIEVGLVGGLTAAGIPQSAAVAAALIERAVTAYLPLIWGWATPVWMRHREYI